MVLTAIRALSLFISFGLLGGGIGDGDGVTDSRPPRRKLKSVLDGLSFSFGSSSFEAFSLPLLFFGVTVAKSSTTGVDDFLDRVAVRKLCSREERMRVNVFVGGSGDAGFGGFFCKREDDDATAEAVVVIREGMW